MVLPDPALLIHLRGPFLHRLFIVEAYDEVLNPGIAFPKDLASIRACDRWSEVS
jgi:hypothetical protein